MRPRDSSSWRRFLSTRTLAQRGDPPHVPEVASSSMTSGTGRVASGAYTFPSMTGTFPRDYPRFLRLAGLAVWLTVGLPVLTSWKALHGRGSQPLDYGAWLAAWALFGAAFLVTTAASRFERDRPGALALLAAQAAAAIALA